MVLTGDLSPDPSNRTVENLLSPDAINVVPIEINSDSEEEEISYEGYEVLPQDFISSSNNEPDEDSSSEETNEINVDSTAVREISAFDQSTQLEQTELWNSTNSNRLTDIIIDSTKEEEIKNAMAGFELPSTAIPPWAEHIPEEEWKQQLINRVHLLNKIKAV